jgi:hypothetical protein
VKFNSPPIFDEPTEDEDAIYGDTGAMLVIRHALNFSPIQDVYGFATTFSIHDVLHMRSYVMLSLIVGAVRM